MSAEKRFTAAYIPFAVGTFHLETAQTRFDESISELRAIDEGVLVPEKLLLSITDLQAYLATLPSDVDFLLLQNLTFANAAYTQEVLRRFSAPAVLWTLREEEGDGGRLKLNALIGAFSAANALQAIRKRPVDFIFGNPGEKGVTAFLQAAFAAARLRAELRTVHLAQIGHAPQGFSFGDATEKELVGLFGVNLVKIEARELMEEARKETNAVAGTFLAAAEKRIKGFSSLPEKNVLDFARLYKSYSDFVRKNNIAALSSRCWPDFFTDYGTPVCAVLSLLNAEGVAASCEGDTWGALSMLIASRLSGRPAFFGDPAALSESENTITFWHCGMAACSLARTDTGAQTGVHPNRKIGPTMEFGCQAAEKATVFRLGKDSQGNFRFFVLKGKILDRPRQFLGTTLVFNPDGSALKIVEQAVRAGWEPHFVVAYGDISRELCLLAHFSGIPLFQINEAQ